MNVRESVPALFALSLAACGGDVRGPELTAATSELTTTNGNQLNGNQLNGNQLNGNQLNGNQLNGSQLAGVSFSDVTIDGNALDSVFLRGSELRGRRGWWRTYAGDDFEDAKLTGVSDTGVDVRLKIVRVGRESWPDNDTWLYWVSFKDPDRGWTPICVDAAGGVGPSIAIAGRWDYRQGVPGGGDKIADPESFTFACKGLGAIGKCVSPIGYRPWRSKNGTSLDAYHQACVRLIRADYCGDGRSYTVNGNRVNLYDDLGVQRDTQFLWLREAEWDENGARCYSPLNRSPALLAAPCVSAGVLGICGLPILIPSDTLLISETPPLSNLGL